MRVNIGFDSVLQWIATMMIAGFLWRSVAARLSDSAVGKAMAFIY
jgi:hypothetical protein